jgi:hypothetical protein
MTEAAMTDEQHRAAQKIIDDLGARDRNKLFVAVGTILRYREKRRREDAGLPPLGEDENFPMTEAMFERFFSDGLTIGQVHILQSIVDGLDDGEIVPIMPAPETGQ